MGFKGGVSNLYCYVYDDPIRFSDPNGMLLPDQHYGITFLAALTHGYSVDAASKLAYYAVQADYIEGSQGADPQSTARHAMAGWNGDRYETPDEARARTLQFINSELAKANAAKAAGDCESYYRSMEYAIHAAQDQWSLSHNYQPWRPDDPVAVFDHTIGDIVSSLYPQIGAARSTHLILYGLSNAAIRR
jgi:hypothetical protein